LVGWLVRSGSVWFVCVCGSAAGREASIRLRHKMLSAPTFISVLVCALPSVYAGSTYANFMQLDVKPGPTIVKQDGTSTPMAAVQSVLEMIAGEDSCTSTRTADSVVTTADTINCDLTSSTDDGTTAGSCAVASGSSSTHTCAYVAGTWVAASLVRRLITHHAVNRAHCRLL